MSTRAREQISEQLYSMYMTVFKIILTKWKQVQNTSIVSCIKVNIDIIRLTLKKNNLSIIISHIESTTIFASSYPLWLQRSWW